MRMPGNALSMSAINPVFSKIEISLKSPIGAYCLSADADDNALYRFASFVS
jgi:hypothetical protein